MAPSLQGLLRLDKSSWGTFWCLSPMLGTPGSEPKAVYLCVGMVFFLGGGKGGAKGLYHFSNVWTKALERQTLRQPGGRSALLTTGAGGLLLEF